MAGNKSNNFFNHAGLACSNTLLRLKPTTLFAKRIGPESG